MFQDKVGFHFGEKLVHHRRLLSSRRLHLQKLDTLRQDDLAVHTLGGDKADLTVGGIQLVQTLNGSAGAVCDQLDYSIQAFK